MIGPFLLGGGAAPAAAAPWWVSEEADWAALLIEALLLAP